MRGAGNDLEELQNNLMTRSKNINGATDFTVAGGANANTKHVPAAIRKAAK